MDKLNLTVAMPTDPQATENVQPQDAGQVINPDQNANTVQNPPRIPLPSVEEAVKTKREEILKRLEPLRITSKTEVEEDKPIVWKVESEDERVPLFPIRYVHMITAKPKRGKSTIVRLIIGLVLLVKRLFCFESDSSKPEKVVLIDTEHSKYDTKKIIEKIAKQTGVPYDLIDEYVYIHHAQSQSREELKQSLEELLFAWKPKLVILDGCAQFVSSFNDEVECDEFWRHLRELSEQYDASVITVLHTTKSPDNDLPKGHLGSLGAQYCCTVVLLEKPKGSNVFYLKDYGSRHAPFSDFSFYIDKGGLICDASEIIANLEKEEKARKQREKEEALRKMLEALKAWANETLTNAGGTMPKKAFLDALAAKLGKGVRNCYTEYNALVADKVIFETPQKTVMLSSSAL
ncbi:MAG: AAA family ATPase [Prevotella sp.]|nr:AAA family ATPase [Prevotella sp.]